MAIGGSHLLTMMDQGDWSSILGVSIGFLLILAALATAPKLSRYLGWIQASAKFASTLSLVFSLCAIISNMIFPNSNLALEVYLFIGSIFTMVPTLLGLISAAYAFSVMTGDASPKLGAGIDVTEVTDDQLEGFDKFSRIYRLMILGYAIFGFTCLATVLGGMI